jgi:hypothetical protein
MGEAGQNSHPISMIYNRRDKLMQEKKPPLTSPATKANGGYSKRVRRTPLSI